MEQRSKLRVENVARSVAKNNEDAGERQSNAENNIRNEVKEI